jgi:type I restriction enzyme S subunit
MPTLAEAIGGKDRVIGGPFGSKLTQADYKPAGVPVIRGSNMEVAGRYLGGEYAFVSDEKLQRDLTSNIAKPGDIVVTQRGTLGQVGIIPERPFDRYVVSQSQMAISCDTKKCSPLFVYYFLRSPKFLSYLEAETIQVGVPHINLGLLRNVPTQWPEVIEQENIASILGALDDKIELNQRMNQTLEAMARALFMDWFVDFGPTRAKVEGRLPYLAPNIWSLFPERLNDSATPEGWKAGSLDDLLILQRGFDLPNDKRVSGSYAVMAASGPNGFHNEFMVQGPGVTTGRSGVLGNVFFIHENFWPLNTSLWVKEFKASTPTYAYYLLQNIDLASFNAGSAVPTLNRNHIHRLQLPVPSKSLITAFDEAAMPLLRQKRSNELESERLADMRDFLLPKLVAGGTRLKDATKKVEEAL